MAKVRCNPELSFEERGLPSDLSYQSRSDSRLYISDTEDEKNVSLETAKRYAKYGRKIINDSNGKPTWVEHPDLHSHSWLTTEEFEKSLKFYSKNSDGHMEVEYEAVLAAMKKLEEFDNEARIVFWFDN